MTTPTPGESPLVERIDSDTEYLHVTPTFGGLLKVAQFGSHGPGVRCDRLRRDRRSRRP